MESYLHEIVYASQEELSLPHMKFTIVPARNCLLQGDFHRSIEVIQNIMENAIKYGDGKQIVIKAWDEEECRLISIINTGIPPKETELPYLFESFWRGEHAQK